MDYWAGKEVRKRTALAHIQEMDQRYGKQTDFSVQNTVVYGGNGADPGVVLSGAMSPGVVVRKADSVSAIYAFFEGKTAVLNFASYKNPGGMFLNGSSAQEESLCHESNLYNILRCFDASYYDWNRTHKNRALYTDRALYTPGVVFEKKGHPPVYCDVITCAAPNFRAAKEYAHVSDSENAGALRSRITFIKRVAEANGVYTLILGAYGCGVFGQNPYETAAVFVDVFRKTTVNKIVYAIPDDANLNVFWKRIWHTENAGRSEDYVRI